MQWRERRCESSNRSDRHEAEHRLCLEFDSDNEFRAPVAGRERKTEKNVNETSEMDSEERERDSTGGGTNHVTQQEAMLGLLLGSECGPYRKRRGRENGFESSSDFAADREQQQQRMSTGHKLKHFTRLTDRQFDPTTISVLPDSQWHASTERELGKVQQSLAFHQR